MSQIDKNIATNLKRIRKSRNLSLDMLADITGVSKSMLGQIERGESNPTVTTISKIVDGLNVAFEELIYAHEEGVTMVDMAQMSPVKEEKGKFAVRAIFPYDKQRKFEVYQYEIQPGSICELTFKTTQDVEYILLTQGDVELCVGKESYHIMKDVAVRFPMNREGVYKNVGQELAKFYVVLSNEQNVYC